jgi:hypothetical protein
VDILVALSPPAIQPAVQATATLPIVWIGVPTRSGRHQASRRPSRRTMRARRCKQSALSTSRTVV